MNLHSTSSSHPVRWGILSTALIGREKVIPAMLKTEGLCIAAIASRDLPSAEKVARQFGIGKAYGSYEALLADPSIEAIYNPLPNHLHVPLSLAAAQAGKHVLCEKPFALHARELEVLRPYASKVHIAEAFMVRHHPQWIGAREWVRQGLIGRPSYIQIPFSYFNDDPHNIRNQVDIGGGALYDVGCYAIVAGRWFFETDPIRVIALMDRDPSLGTDRTTSALLDFGAGQQLALSISTQTARHQRLTIVGTRGWIEIDVPFNAPLTGATSYHLHTAEGKQTVTTPQADMYQLQAQAFCQRIRHETPNVADLDDAQMNLRVIEALFESEKTQAFVPL